MVSTVDEGPGLRRAQKDQGTPGRQPPGELRSIAGVRNDSLNVVDQRVRGLHLAHGYLQRGKRVYGEPRLEELEHLPTILAAHELALRNRIRVAELYAHQKAIKLRLRQRIRSRLARGVLRRDDEERFGQSTRLALHRDLPFLHRFKKSALSLRRGPVDFIGEHDLRKHGAGMEAELGTVPIEDRNAEDVRRQHVGRELDTVVAQAEGACERVRADRLPMPGRSSMSR